jgi:phosphatidylglycerophosphatase A
MNKKRSLSDTVSFLCATMCGVGYTPVCPGTAATLFAIIPFLLIKSSLVYLILTIAVTIISFPVSDRSEEIFGEKDSKKIVIDDFAGMLITYLWIPKTAAFVVCGFFVFRMIDVLKVPPADRIEKFPGAKGVVGDDIVAGIYANIILQIARLLVNIFS